MKHLTVEQVIALHSQLIAASGGVDGVRDKDQSNHRFLKLSMFILELIAIQLLKRRLLGYVTL